MLGETVSLATALRALVALVVVLIAAIVIAMVLGSGLAFLGFALWVTALGVAAVGVFLIARGGRPLAGAGASATAISVLLAFFWLPQPAPIVWTILFFVGIALVVAGTARDTPSRAGWVLLLPRVAIGWSLVDNAQDHFRSGWLPGGGQFAKIASDAASRPSLYFLDPAYQGFLKGAVVPQADLWAALTICGEMVFGLLLALGLCTAVASLGAMWQNGNYMLMKGFVAHGAYTDKAFFAVELFSLVTAAGLAYGLDAALHRQVPGWVASTLMGAAAPEAPPASAPQRQPGLV